jgi:hypothetical protein
VSNTDNLLKFPLRPSVAQAEHQTIFTKLKEMGVSNGFVLGTDATGRPVFFCDPDISVSGAIYLLENARFRLMGRPPPHPQGSA